MYLLGSYVIKKFLICDVVSKLYNDSKFFTLEGLRSKCLSAPIVLRNHKRILSLTERHIAKRFVFLMERVPLFSRTHLFRIIE